MICLVYKYISFLYSLLYVNCSLPLFKGVGNQLNPYSFRAQNQGISLNGMSPLRHKTLVQPLGHNMAEDLDTAARIEPSCTGHITALLT